MLCGERLRFKRTRVAETGGWLCVLRAQHECASGFMVEPGVFAWASRSSEMVGAWPYHAARAKGVQPLRSASFTLAFASTSFEMTGAWPAAAAELRGVWPLSVARAKSALASKRNDVRVACPGGNKQGWRAGASTRPYVVPLTKAIWPQCPCCWAQRRT